MSESSQRLADAFETLARILTSKEDVESTLEKISTMSVEIINGCDYAGISLVEPGTIRTVGYTDPIVLEVDAIQYETGEGPCLSATEAPVDGSSISYEIPVMAEDGRWPNFSSRAASRGLASLLAYALRVSKSESALGSLNLYARRPHAFDDDDRDVAAIFAAHASVTPSNAQALERAEKRVHELETGLATRDVIGQAKGILMERENCTEEEAFALLTRASQLLHVKLRDIARDVVSHPDQDGR